MHTVVSQTPQKWRSQEVWSIFIILAVGKWRIGIWWKSCMEAAYLQCLPMWSDTGLIVPQRNSSWPQTFVIVDHIVFLKLLSWDKIDNSNNLLIFFNIYMEVHISFSILFIYIFYICNYIMYCVDSIQWDIAFRIYIIVFNDLSEVLWIINKVRLKATSLILTHTLSIPFHTETFNALHRALA